MLLVLLLLRRDRLQRRRDALAVVGLLVGDDVDVLSFLFLELSDLGWGGVASPNDEPSWSFPSNLVRRAPLRVPIGLSSSGGKGVLGRYLVRRGAWWEAGVDT